MRMDLQSVQFMAEERIKREPTLTMQQAIMSAIGDCLVRDNDPTYKPERVFIDWNWRRLDSCKEARKRKEAPLQLAA